MNHLKISDNYLKYKKVPITSALLPGLHNVFADSLLAIIEFFCHLDIYFLPCGWPVSLKLTLVCCEWSEQLYMQIASFFTPYIFCFHMIY